SGTHLLWSLRPRSLRGRRVHAARAGIGDARHGPAQPTRRPGWVPEAVPTLRQVSQALCSVLLPHRPPGAGVPAAGGAAAAPAEAAQGAGGAALQPGPAAAAEPATGHRDVRLAADLPLA